MRSRPAPSPGAETEKDIREYYARWASSYDALRFGSSYGRYLDAQERAVLREWIPGAGRILEIGCGTGRLLDLATDGLDSSPEMLAIARKKRPACNLVQSTGAQAPFRDGSFDAIFSMHVFMHLSKPAIAQIVDECRRLLCRSGTLVFDLPSQPRRSLTGFLPSSWHARTAFTPEEVSRMCSEWRSVELRGLLALPIHRVPGPLRPCLLPLDSAISGSLLRRWCSYYLVRLEKQ